MIPQEPRDYVRIITLDNPPVNALSFAYCAKLREEIASAAHDGPSAS
jgi:enoyl-CoA hydratase/carnithine racemase